MKNRGALGQPVNQRVRRKRNVSEPDGITQRGLRNLGGKDIGWWDATGENGEVRAIRGQTTLDNNGQMRISAFQNNGYMLWSPPNNTDYSVPQVELIATQATSAALHSADFTRQTDAWEGACGFSVKGGTVGNGGTWSQYIGFGMPMYYTPDSVTLDEITSSNCTASAQNLDTHGFELRLTITTGASDATWWGRYKAIAPGQTPPTPPSGSGPVYGIDIYHGNGTVTAGMLNGLDFVLFKATQGTGYNYASWLANAVSVAQGEGIEYGFYHFGTNHPGATQADYFISVVDALSGVDPDKHALALDWEYHPGDQMTSTQGQDFVTRVQTHFAYNIGVYASEGRPYPSWGQDWRWVAHWGVNKPSIPYHVHQFSNTYQFPNGQHGDGDRAPYSLAALNAIWHN